MVGLDLRVHTNTLAGYCIPTYLPLEKRLSFTVPHAAITFGSAGKVILFILHSLSEKVKSVKLQYP